MRLSMKSLLAFALLVVPLAAGCAAHHAERQQIVSGTPNGLAPALALDRFLRAANANDLKAMGQFFGTAQGPITKLDSPQNVEQRMYALATMLRYRDYQLKGQRIVPGRLGQAVELDVALDLADGRKVSVPFTMVRTSDDQWLVEKFDTDPLVSR
jgi:hypothetical protein